VPGAAATAGLAALSWPARAQVNQNSKLRIFQIGVGGIGASTIDAFDAHDGHPLTKGHAGVAVLPALLAVADAEGGGDGRDLLAALVLGYEVAIRAGIALHASVPDYHTSGAWNALGCAAVAARLLGLSADATRHALGIAEYHGPRSQMMRCIDHPTMVKDGSGFGALAGVSAACLAADGFTGAPALLIEGDAEAPFWRDLGAQWEIMRQYHKPWPICRWAQPAMDATVALMREHRVDPGAVAGIEIRSFAEAVRLGTRPPRSTEEAQYAIGFPVAAVAVRGVLGAAELGDAGLNDPEIGAMLARLRLIEEPDFSRRFPAERLAAVTLTLRDGTRLCSGPTTPRGDPEHALSDHEISEKFRQFAGALGDTRVARIECCVATLDRDVDALPALNEAILTPI